MKKFITCIYFVILGIFSFAGNYTHVNYFQKDRTEIQGPKDFSYGNSDSETRFEDRIGLEYGKIVNNYKINSVKITFMKGYNLNPYLYLGVGTGFKLYFGNQDTYNFTDLTPSLPLFASFRLNFANTPFTPYLAIDAGYSVIARIDGPKFFYNPTFGFRFPFGNKNKMNIGVGYEKQWLEKADFFHPESYIKSMNINMGITF